MCIKKATVISLHEDPKLHNADSIYIKSIRAHTINVLSQLSTEANFLSAGSISIISVRMIMKDESNSHDSGAEGSSNLFYYLFDNWYGTYKLITNTQDKLIKLVSPQTSFHETVTNLLSRAKIFFQAWLVLLSQF
jgi:hypothetical protein